MEWRRYSQGNFPNILKLVDDLQAIGKKHGATAGQVSLAWLLAQGEDVIPIPGTKSIKVCDKLLNYALRRFAKTALTLIYSTSKRTLMR